MTSGSSTLTSAPTTPREVSLKYSNERPLLTVLRNGYKKRVIWAFRKSGLVSLCEATHWRRANTLHALLEVLLSSRGGDSSGYTDTISCKRAAIVPTECQIKGANSEKCSLGQLHPVRKSAKPVQEPGEGGGGGSAGRDV